MMKMIHVSKSALAEDLPENSGLLFASGDELRYLAPEAAGNYSAVYAIRGEDGQVAQATVRISVREVDEETNMAMNDFMDAFMMMR